MAMDRKKREEVLYKRREEERKKQEAALKSQIALEEKAHKSRLVGIDNESKKIADLEKKKRENGKLSSVEEKKLKESKEKRYKLEREHQSQIEKDSKKNAERRQLDFQTEFDQKSGLFSLVTNFNATTQKQEKVGNDYAVNVGKELIEQAKSLNEAELNIGTSTFTVSGYKDDIIKSQNKIGSLQSLELQALESGDKQEAAKIRKMIIAEELRVGGLESLQAQVDLLEEQHNGINAIKESNEAMLKPLTDMEDKFNAIAATVEGIVTNPLVLLVAGIAMLGKHFVATEQAAEDFRKSMGLSIGESKELETTAMNVAKNMGTAGVTFEESLSAVESLTKEFGDMGIASEKNVETVMRMNKALGMSTDEAANFLNTISSISGGSIETAENLAASTVNMARLAGVAPQTVIKDMTANADAFAGYIKDGGENMAEAAVFAAKMGASMSQLVGMADHLLDIESSTEKMMEAQVLTGRSINLEKARELALNNDIKGMGEEILKQVGSEAEWNEMNAIQRKALAEAMGMTTSEMGNMISKQGTLKELADGTLSTQEALANLPLSEVMDAKGITSGITDIKNSIQAIALNLMEIFRPVFSFIAMILKPIAATLGFVAGLLNNSFIKFLLVIVGLWKLINSQVAYGMVLKAKDFAIEMARSIKKKAMAVVDFARQVREQGILRGLRTKFEALKVMWANKEAARTKAQQLLETGGIKSKIAGLKDKITGKSSVASSTASPMKSVAPSTPSMKGAGTKSQGAGGFMKSVGNIDMNKVLKGAAAMVVVAAALFVFAKALQQMPTEVAPYVGAAVGLGMLTGAVFLMGKLQGDLIKGSAALLIMGLAFIPFAFGMSLLADVTWEGVIAAAGALVIFTAAIFGLGLLMSSGVGAVMFGAGILAFAALGATLIIFGAGLMMAGKGATLLSDSLTGIAIGIVMLTGVTDGVFTMATALGALSLGFISLAGSLLLLTPFVPLLMLLGASGVIGQILGVTEVSPPEEVESKGGKRMDNLKKKSQEMMVLTAINNSINRLTEAVKEGGDVKLDGKKVGDVLGNGLLGSIVG